MAPAARRQKSVLRSNNARRVGWFVSTFAVCGLAPSANESIDIRSSPYLPFPEPNPAQYNIKIGLLKARLKGSVQGEFNDNINLSDDGETSDISIGPYVGVGLYYPVNDEDVLEFNLEGGYRWYLRHSELNSFDIAPNSRLSHAFRAGGVDLIVWDSVSVSVDPTTVGEISGDAELLNFRRINNSAGLVANTQPFDIEKLNLNASYTYGYNRSLSDQFTSLDRDTHTFGAGLYYSPTVRWTLGMTGNYTLTFYKEDVQNDGRSFSVGPLAIYRPSKHLYFRAGVSYVFSNFDLNGSITDASDASTVQFTAAAQHDFNKRRNHNLQVRRVVGPGVGSNFSEILAVQYSLNTIVNPKTSLQGRLSYENISASGANGEQSNRYLATLAVGHKFGRHWSGGLRYSFAWKDSNRDGRDYQQNRFVLEMNRQF